MTRNSSSRLPLAAVSIVLAIVATPALAQDGTTVGTIVAMSLNSEVPGRGLCVQMSVQSGSPPLPAQAWACLASSNPLNKEITSLLMSAYLSGRQCTVWTKASASLPNEIRALECR
jgi:hypothetical protein